MLWSTSDRVIDLAADHGVPDVVCADLTRLRDRAGEALFPVSRYIRSVVR